MKKVLLSVVLLLTLAFSQTFSQTLLTEDFDYAAGTALLGQGSWTITGTSTTNPFTVGAAGSGLSFTGYTGSGVGLALPLMNNGQDAYKPLSSSVTSGSVYTAFLVNVSAAQTTQNYVGDYFVNLNQGITTSAYFNRVYVRSADNGKLTFGVAKTSAVPSSSAAGIYPAFTDSIYSLNTTYLVVTKYTFSAATTTDDQVSIFVFTDGTLPLTEPTPNATFTSSQTDATSIDNLQVRQGTAANAPTLVLDGFRVSTAWDFALSTPVEMTTFTASVGNGVKLNWSTATETNNKGFEVERKSANSSWTKVGFVQGKGTTTSAQSYSFTDKAQNGSYSYRLKQVDFDGTSSYSKTVSVEVNNVINSYSLDQNYPNPFNPSTTISFSTAKAGNVSLKVYNLIGQEVRTLVNGMMEAGNHTVQFNAAGLNSGMYFYKLETENFSQVRKMTLMK